MLSTMNRPNSTTTVKHKLNDGSTVEVACPQCIVDYNHFVSGLDKGEYIFWFLFDVAVTNSFILMS